MPDYKGLKELIRQRYGTENALAIKLGWTKQHLSNITRGRKKNPSIDEIDALSVKLGKKLSDIAQFFLAKESLDGQH